jgi:hypothetical protein
MWLALAGGMVFIANGAQEYRASAKLKAGGIKLQGILSASEVRGPARARLYRITLDYQPEDPSVAKRPGFLARMEAF